MARLDGRPALVTGATSNIGRGIALALAAEGAQVVVAGRDAERGAEVVATIEAAGGRAVFLAAELDGSAAASRALAAAAGEPFGPIRILVNNAGIYPGGGTLDTDEATYDRVMGVNLKAPFFLTAALVPAMVAAGGGVVINLASWIGKLAIPGAAAYSTSKGALETLTRTWAAEFGPSLIRVNAVSPGVVHEDMSRLAAGAGALMASAPAGAPGHPQDIAAAVVFLASDDAAFVHGTVLDVDGGRAAVFLSAPAA
jgi:NAD(P)-dependent dehydrogenase (short-subunit alcohol dehydrogenase family)